MSAMPLSPSHPREKQRAAGDRRQRVEEIAFVDFHRLTSARSELTLIY
jgi:hypothetical protein